MNRNPGKSKSASRSNYGRVEKTNLIRPGRQHHRGDQALSCLAGPCSPPSPVRGSFPWSNLGALKPSEDGNLLKTNLDYAHQRCSMKYATIKEETKIWRSAGHTRALRAPRVGGSRVQGRNEEVEFSPSEGHHCTHVVDCRRSPGGPLHARCRLSAVAWGYTARTLSIFWTVCEGNRQSTVTIHLTLERDSSLIC